MDPSVTSTTVLMWCTVNTTMMWAISKACLCRSFCGHYMQFGPIRKLARNHFLWMFSLNGANGAVTIRSVSGQSLTWLTIMIQRNPEGMIELHLKQSPQHSQWCGVRGMPGVPGCIVLSRFNQRHARDDSSKAS